MRSLWVFSKIDCHAAFHYARKDDHQLVFARKRQILRYTRFENSHSQK